MGKGTVTRFGCSGSNHDQVTEPKFNCSLRTWCFAVLTASANCKVLEHSKTYFKCPHASQNYEKNVGTVTRNHIGLWNQLLGWKLISWNILGDLAWSGVALLAIWSENITYVGVDLLATWSGKNYIFWNCVVGDMIWKNYICWNCVVGNMIWKSCICWNCVVGNLAMWPGKTILRKQCKYFLGYKYRKLNSTSIWIVFLWWL